MPRYNLFSAWFRAVCFAPASTWERARIGLLVLPLWVGLGGCHTFEATRVHADYTYSTGPVYAYDAYLSPPSYPVYLYDPYFPFFETGLRLHAHRHLVIVDEPWVVPPRRRNLRRHEEEIAPSFPAYRSLRGRRRF